MTRLRVRIVTGGRGRSGPARGFIAGSLAVHVVLAALLVFIPELLRGPRVPPNATVVELVGGLPGPRASAPAPQPPSQAPAPQPPAPKPEGVTVQKTAPPKAPKAPEKKKKDEKKPAPASTEPAPPAAPSPAPASASPGAPGSAAAGAQVAGSAAAGGSVSALDLGDAAFAWYRAAVANALYGAWRRPVLAGLREPLEVRVAFEIMRDGNVRGLRVEQPSGVPVLDRSALRAVSDATPLPALPPSLREPYLPASIVFRLHPEGT